MSSTTSSYRFCGLQEAVGEFKYSRFGQICEFTDEMAIYLISGRGAFVSAADFDKEQFTEQELTLYSNPAGHGRASAAFLAKKKRVLLTIHATRERLASGGPLRIADTAEPEPIVIEIEPSELPAA